MNRIDDNELILYHYRDGLDASRIGEIAAALAQSPALSERHIILCSTLELADAEAAPQPDEGFERRLWHMLDARIDAASPARTPWWLPLREWLAAWSLPRPALSGALLVVFALGVAFYAGRHSAPAPDVLAQERANAMATRVLDAYVAEHLRATEGVLLTAANSDSAPLQAGNRELAANLLDSNRLYASAAARAGNTRLADFLRQLEPILIELANRRGDDDIQSIEGLREYLSKTDLLFQVRATQARIDAAGKRPVSI
ncbi:MAG: hypothetical protein ABI411_06500 [Tahibacter sp.]